MCTSEWAGRVRGFQLYLPHESKPWNPWIAKVFYRRGIIETWGRCTLKITALMQEAGLQAPHIKVSNDFLTMTYTLPTAQNSLQNPGKTPERLLLLLLELPNASIPEMADRLGMSVSAIERAIRKLRVDGKLQRIGPAKGGYCQVVP